MTASVPVLLPDEYNAAELPLTILQPEPDCFGTHFAVAFTSKEATDADDLAQELVKARSCDRNKYSKLQPRLIISNAAHQAMTPHYNHA